MNTKLDIHISDCKEALKNVPNNTVDLIFTSPPYADQRKNTNWVDRQNAYPTNVLHLATECGNKNHSAAFPEQLPEWFIKLFTKEQDIVLDPFSSSGTTNLVAQKMRRHSIAIEIVPEYAHRLKIG